MTQCVPALFVVRVVRNTVRTGAVSSACGASCAVRIPGHCSPLQYRQRYRGPHNAIRGLIGSKISSECFVRGHRERVHARVKKWHRWMSAWGVEFWALWADPLRESSCTSTSVWYLWDQDACSEGRSDERHLVLVSRTALQRQSCSCFAVWNVSHRVLTSHKVPYIYTALCRTFQMFPKSSKCLAATRSLATSCDYKHHVDK
jgi:hypothetical protein